MNRVVLGVAVMSAVVSFSASAQSSRTTRTRTPGHVSRNTVVTGVNGKSASYNRNAAWGNGTYTGSRSATGFHGRTATSSTTASVAPGSATRTTTATGPNGRSATYQNHATWGNGSYSDTKTITGANGKSASSTVQRQDGTVTKTVTGPNGQGWTASRTRVQN
ncbi:MAG: hypothetical protein J0H49_38020 [Acidobacteria bacterium]|nr:hypothetical protein [Acidobacteriota bacterium]